MNLCVSSTHVPCACKRHGNLCHAVWATYSARNACTPIYVLLLLCNALDAPLIEVIQVAQKMDIKRQKERIVVLRREEEEEKQRVKESARQRVLRDFEKGQLGLSMGRGSDKEATDVACSPDERM